VKRPSIKRPASIVDFIAFEDHIKAIRAKRGLEVPDIWYIMPMHYNCNHLGVRGNGDVVPYPEYTSEFDFELELACVIGEGGINIKEEDARKHIYGYTIMNDWSCRDVQRDEMSGGLGPGRLGKPGPSLGPRIVLSSNLPELADMRELPDSGPLMQAYINGELWSEGRFGAIHWSFAQMIAHLSRINDGIHAGEILGSGTIGGGCCAELGRWIQPGDTVTLKIEGIGELTNKIGPKSIKRKKRR